MGQFACPGKRSGPEIIFFTEVNRQIEQRAAVFCIETATIVMAVVIKKKNYLVLCCSH
jgi:hypothetical protein